MTTEPKHTPLKPCPFCGGESFLVSAIKISQQSRYSIRCRDCLVETPSCTDSLMISAQWNTRHESLTGLVGELADVLHDVYHTEGQNIWGYVEGERVKALLTKAKALQPAAGE